MVAADKKQKYLPIEDYGIIGNLHTVALVSLFGSIDFMCFPRFDAPTVFGKLLDAEKGGSFSITPLMNDPVSKQLYLPDTNVLVTRFFSEEGIAEVIDYMPIVDEEENMIIIRKLATIRGKIKFRVNCAPRFDYARSRHEVKKKGDALFFIPENKDQQSLVLISEKEIKIEEKNAVSEFEMNENDSTFFILSSATADFIESTIPLKDYVKNSYNQTIDYWQHWISQCQYEGHWVEVVRRSALVLKLLICKTYGSMVAAPTFSLPEAIGQARNWDYRYTWIRDAAFSMHAFLQLGFLGEAEQFLVWIQKQSTEKELQLMFSIDGKTDLKEYTLDYLEGYKKSKPVRVGNDAHRQTQMDIYGELLETIYIFVKHGGDITYEFWKIIESYIEFVVKNWDEPDHSIWEVRGEKREFLFSRMMCWVAIDRAIRIGDIFSFPYDFTKWHNVRNDIYKDVYDNFWNENIEAFVQYKGSDRVDASALLMPILNIISPQSPKWQKTMNAIDHELRSDVLVYRYREKGEEIDGLKGREGTFSICSFWYVECLALAGETQKAKVYFEKMLGYANHLGLYAEQIGMKGEHLGNFPQAFTHLALISAAIELSNQKKEVAARMSNIKKEMK
jgi:GH15 family glucan-1,4-alpha-glucosidase